MTIVKMKRWQLMAMNLCLTSFLVSMTSASQWKRFKITSNYWKKNIRNNCRKLTLRTRRVSASNCIYSHCGLSEQIGNLIAFIEILSHCSCAFFNEFITFIGLGNEADQIVDDTNKIANEVKEKLEAMVKTDTTGIWIAYTYAIQMLITCIHSLGEADASPGCRRAD